MKFRIGWVPLLAVMLSLVLGSLFFVLPSLGTKVFLSPDETAAVAAARSFAEKGTMRFPSSFLESENWFPWVHPRSFVMQRFPNGMVPVGFLGMFGIFGFLSMLFGSFIFSAGTPLLAVSVVLPLWLLMRPYGKMAQFATIAVWLTFPTVILYANRGMFPNLPVLCLAMWAVWLLLGWKRSWSLFSAGMLIGFALSIRPTEAVWVLAWVGLAFIFRERQAKLIVRTKRFILLSFSCLLVCAVFAVLGERTYSEFFTAGYQLRDPIEYSIGWAANGSSKDVLETSSKTWFDTWPFGFHPRNVLFNVKWYLLFFLMPWFAVSVAAIGIAWKKEKRLRTPILVVSGTVAALCLLYGQGLYQDHVRPNFISVGNSFLRYLLPVSVVAAISAGWFAGFVEKHVPKFGRVLAIVGIVLLAGFGIWSATVRDDEGIVQNRIELKKYAETREKAKQFLPDDAVIVSERSDKIFFPEWQAVSPMVSRERLKAFLDRNPGRLALFLRTVTPEQQNEWLNDGFILTPVLEMGNETLYLVRGL